MCRFLCSLLGLEKIKKVEVEGRQETLERPRGHFAVFLQQGRFVRHPRWLTSHPVILAKRGTTPGWKMTTAREMGDRAVSRFGRRKNNPRHPSRSPRGYQETVWYLTADFTRRTSHDLSFGHKCTVPRACPPQPHNVELRVEAGTKSSHPRAEAFLWISPGKSWAALLSSRSTKESTGNKGTMFRAPGSTFVVQSFIVTGVH